MAAPVERMDPIRSPGNGWAMGAGSAFVSAVLVSSETRPDHLVVGTTFPDRSRTCRDAASPTSPSRSGGRFWVTARRERLP